MKKLNSLNHLSAKMKRTLTGKRKENFNLSINYIKHILIIMNRFFFLYRNRQPNRKSFGIKARIKKIGGKKLKLTLKKQLSEKGLFPKCKYQYTPVLYFLLLKLLTIPLQSSYNTAK